MGAHDNDGTEGGGDVHAGVAVVGGDAHAEVVAEGADVHAEGSVVDGDNREEEEGVVVDWQIQGHFHEECYRRSAHEVHGREQTVRRVSSSSAGFACAFVSSEIGRLGLSQVRQIQIGSPTRHNC